MNSAETATRDALVDGLLAPALTLLVSEPGSSRNALAAGHFPDGTEVVAVPIGAVDAARSAAGNGSGERSTPQPRRGAAEAALLYDVDVAGRAERLGVTGRAGDILTVFAPRTRAELPDRAIFVGVGDESAQSFRAAGAALAKATQRVNGIYATVVDGLSEDLQSAFAEGFLLGSYRGPRAGKASEPKPPAAKLLLSGCAAEALQMARITAEATCIARNLANMPANIKNPEWIAEQSRLLAADAGLGIHVRDQEQLTEEGFGGLLAVAGAADSEPRLVQLSYTPGKVTRRTRHIVLVGKGITFDTGGISLKPAESMVPMKTDMSGAAAVVAVLAAAARLGIPHRITGLLALAENAIGGAAYRPGDVVTAYGGTTIEVGNTDAEGRMVLADALAYAVESLDPDVLVDIATLTGAAAMGLGRRYGALYSNEPELAAAFEAAGRDSGDPVWQLPLVDEYAVDLESGIADLSHIQPKSSKLHGGSIFAALFLREFVGETPWVHMDIAGPARAAADYNEVTKGATGFGTRLLLAFLRNYRPGSLP